MAHTEVEMPSIPLCDIDKAHGKAWADAKLNVGPWAYVCKACFEKYECSLGLGLGQRLVSRATEDQR